MRARRCSWKSRIAYDVVRVTLLMLAVVRPAWGQEPGVLAGTVRDAETLTPLASAQVSVVGTGIGALTDPRGGFRLEGVPAGTVEVRIESLGYETATRSLTLAPGQVVDLTFAMTVSAVALDEMIVTVTGLQRRREVGNATATIDVEGELEQVLPPSLLNLLEGRAPGVQVAQSSGSVGSTPSVTIRGSGSFLLDDTPIIYVDGTRVSNDLISGPDVGGQTTSRLSDLNLDDIEQIEVVNGPSAATLYGTEAAAGVIRITTKRGRSGASEWLIHSEVGVNWDVSNWPESVWNPRSFFGEQLDVSQLLDEVPPGQFFVPVPDTLYRLNLLDGGAGGEFGTPWRTGLEQSYGISVRGGAGNVTYFLSGELSDRLGNLSNNELDQRSLRANLTLSPGAELSVQVSTGFSSSRASLPENDNSRFGFIGVGLLGFPWAIPLERQDPVSGVQSTSCPEAIEFQQLLLSVNVLSTLDELVGLCPENPFFEARTFEDVATVENEQEVERFTGGVTVNYEPFPFLRARATLGYDQFSDQVGEFIPVDPTLPFQDLSFGFRSIGNSVARGLTLDLGVNADLGLAAGVRSITSVGAQFYGLKLESASSVGRALPPGINTVSSAVEREGFEFIRESRTVGVYVQQQFGYRDRLFLTPAIRVDESSTFGDDRTRATYPRLMASWVVHEEPWFASVPLLTSLRLRGAWGQSGKEPAPFAALQLLGSRSVTVSGRDRAAVVLVGAGNPDLKPERGEELEVGLDVTALGNRLALGLTWFNQVTRDAFVDRPISPSTGYRLGQVKNVGEVRNQGLELTLSAVAVDRPALRWETRLLLQHLNSEVTRLDEPIIYGYEGNSQRHQEGHPFGSFFSHTYSVMGDQVTASDSAVFVGQPSPTFGGSLITTVGFSDWLQLNAVVGFAGGHQQFNATQQYRCAFLGGGPYGGTCPEIYETDADGQRTPEARIKATAARDVAFGPWIEDADFARLRNVSARVELPASVLGFLNADRGSLTLSGENLGLLTRYSGLDPEINYSRRIRNGRADFLTLPLARRVTGRLALTF